MAARHLRFRPQAGGPSRPSHTTATHSGRTQEPRPPRDPGGGDSGQGSQDSPPAHGGPGSRSGTAPPTCAVLTAAVPLRTPALPPPVWGRSLGPPPDGRDGPVTRQPGPSGRRPRHAQRHGHAFCWSGSPQAWARFSTWRREGGLGTGIRTDPPPPADQPPRRRLPTGSSSPADVHLKTAEDRLLHADSALGRLPRGQRSEPRGLHSQLHQRRDLERADNPPRARVSPHLTGPLGRQRASGHR